MPRSNWKGVISFGLVSIPIVLYPAENKASHISFHQIDKRDHARIKYQRINAETGKEVPWEQITRGYEYDKETTIPVPDEVLNKVAGDKSRSIDIEMFIKKEDLDFLTLENVYYIVPDKGGDKGYVILRDALSQTDKLGIAKVIISTKEYLAAVMPHDDALILALLRYADEMRDPTEFNLPTKDAKSYKINQKEMEIAKQLIKSMTSKWKPDKYIDEYQQSIHKWIEEDVNKRPHPKAKKRAALSKGGAINFVDLLKKSLASSEKPIKKKTASKKAHRVVAKKSKLGKHYSTKH